MVCAPPFSGSTGGQTLAMVGVVLFTVTSTRTFCDFAVTLAPEATTVILATYGATWGANVAAFTLTVSVVSSPGKTIPIAGETVIHGTPEVAVNDIGDPLVESVNVCATDGLGGAVKIRVLGVTAKVEGAAVTWSVTVITAGDNTPATVIVTEEV